MSLPTKTIDELKNMIDEARADPVTSSEPAKPELVKLFWVKPHQCTVWSGNTRDVSSMDAARFDALKASIMAKGQQIAVIGRRIGTSNDIEVIAGARRVAVQKDLARNNPDVMIFVDVREMDDAAAYALVAAENEGRQAFVPIESARFYKHALQAGTYRDQTTLADALGLHKATVGRTLAILDLPHEVLNKVVDPRAISAAQASKFMTHWNDETSQLVMEACLASLKPANAAATFKAVFASVDQTKSRNELQTIDGAIIGTLRSTKAGLKIELNPAADAVELDDIVASIRSRILELRTPN
ncbi:ParB/RepB/Spo0J family partition protein [Glacieibacterium frigidum]|nr:ParB/RepB/Spo0J family partition protein [Glacieibacterium frigidum]